MGILTDLAACSSMLSTTGGNKPSILHNEVIDAEITILLILLCPTGCFVLWRLSTLSSASGCPYRLSRRSLSENAVPANKGHYENVVMSWHVIVGMLTVGTVEQPLWPTCWDKITTNARR